MAILGRSFPIRPHTNYPGRAGVYFNVMSLSGTVSLAAVGVSGAIVRLIRQSTDTEVAKTTTNGSGQYSFTAGTLTAGENYHITVEYTDGSLVKYNAPSLWNVVPIVT